MSFNQYDTNRINVWIITRFGWQTVCFWNYPLYSTRLVTKNFYENLEYYGILGHALE